MSITGKNARLVSLLIAASLCGTSCGALHQPSRTSKGPLPSLAPVAVNRTSGPESSSGPAETSASSAFVDDCVRYIRTGAFTGNVALVRLFDSTHDDPQALRTICTEYGQADLRGLEELPIAQLPTADQTGRSATIGK